MNVVAFLEFGFVLSHQTGNTSHIGRQLGGGTSAMLVICLISYILGAGAAGFGGCDGNAVFEARCSAGLAASAAAVGVGSVAHLVHGIPAATVAAWAFSQGLQNGTTSRFGSLPLRTTHMTGAATDAGLVIGQWMKAWASQQDPANRPSLRKPTLFLLSILGFSLGGAFAALAHKLLGVLAGVLPACTLAAVSTGALLPKPADERKRE